MSQSVRKQSSKRKSKTRLLAILGKGTRPLPYFPSNPKQSSGSFAIDIFCCCRRVSVVRVFRLTSSEEEEANALLWWTWRSMDRSSLLWGEREESCANVTRRESFEFSKKKSHLLVNRTFFFIMGEMYRGQKEMT